MESGGLDRYYRSIGTANEKKQCVYIKQKCTCIT